MGNKMGSDMEKGLNLKGHFSSMQSRALFQPLFHWNEQELKKSQEELNDDIAGDEMISANLREEFNKVREFLKTHGLEEYYQNFEEERVIFTDLKQFLPSDDEESVRETEEILECLISDKQNRKKFQSAIQKEFLSLINESSEDTSSKKKKKKKKSKNTKEVPKMLDLHEEYKDSSWYLQEQWIIMGQTIGSGNYGVIKQGIFSYPYKSIEKVACAIKIMNIDTSQASPSNTNNTNNSSSNQNEQQVILVDEILSEIEIMAEFNHKNTCKLFGALFKLSEDSRKTTVFFVMELCKKGDLFSLLHFQDSSVPKYFEITEEEKKNSYFLENSKNSEKSKKKKFEVLKKGKLKNMKLEFLNLSEISKLLYFFEKEFEKCKISSILKSSSSKSSSLAAVAVAEAEAEAKEEEKEKEENEKDSNNSYDLIRVKENYIQQIRIDYFTVLETKIIQKFYVLVSYILQISEGLRYLHRLGICHFDIKSKNVLVKGKFPHYRLKICDFGTSCHCDDFEFDKFIGTIEYMAPQFFNLHSSNGNKLMEKHNGNDDVDISMTEGKGEDEDEDGNEDLCETDFNKFVKSFDIYSFGILIFEIMNSKIPFQKLRENSDSDFDLFMKIVKKKISPVEEIRKNLEWMDISNYFVFQSDEESVSNNKECSKVEDGKEEESKILFYKKQKKNKKIIDFYESRNDSFVKNIGYFKGILISLMERCFHFDNAKRPSSESIRNEMKEMLVSYKQIFREELNGMF